MSIIVLPTNRIRRSSTPSARRLSLGLGRVQEEQLGEVVGDDPVDLLGHRPVEAAQAGLDVGDRDPELRRAERRSQGRVDVAGNEDQVGALGAQDRLEPLEHPARSARAWLPEPTPSMWSGSGTPSSSKKISDIARS